MGSFSQVAQVPSTSCWISHLLLSHPFPESSLHLSHKDSWSGSPNPTLTSPPTHGSDLRGSCLNWLPSELLPYSLTSTRKAREREKGARTKRMWLGAWSGVVPSEELGRGSGVAPCLALGNLISSLLTIYWDKSQHGHACRWKGLSLEFTLSLGRPLCLWTFLDVFHLSRAQPLSQYASKPGAEADP